MLYVDGVPSTVGVSESLLLEDPSKTNIDVEWKFEKIEAGHPLRSLIARRAQGVGPSNPPAVV